MFNKKRKKNKGDQENRPKDHNQAPTPTKLLWVGTHPRKPIKVAKEQPFEKS